MALGARRARFATAWHDQALHPPRRRRLAGDDRDPPGRPPINTLDPPEARAGSNAARAAMEVELGELAVMRDFAIPGPGGADRRAPVRRRRRARAGRPHRLLPRRRVRDRRPRQPCAVVRRSVAADGPAGGGGRLPAGARTPLPRRSRRRDRRGALAGRARGEIGRAAKRLVLMGDSAGANLALLAGDRPARRAGRGAGRGAGADLSGDRAGRAPAAARATSPRAIS